jgi:7-carboxy-7-deazaguanine synthase
MERLIDADVAVLLETNGSLDVAGVPRPVHIVMDLKTPGSGHHRDNRLENLAALKSTDDLKIVLTSRRDYLWATKMMAEHGLAARCTVYLNPAAGLVDPKLLVKWMLKDRPPARLGLQLHKCIFGDQARRA